MNARYAVGEEVRVSARPSHGHNRTPRYIRGKRGVVERICGTFRNPEDLAYGRYSTEPLPLYRVRFAQRELWDGYRGDDSDTIDVELYENWLDAAGDLT